MVVHGGGTGGSGGGGGCRGGDADDGRVDGSVVVKEWTVDKRMVMGCVWATAALAIAVTIAVLDSLFATRNLNPSQREATLICAAVGIVLSIDVVIWCAGDLSAGEEET